MQPLQTLVAVIFMMMDTTDLTVNSGWYMGTACIYTCAIYLHIARSSTHKNVRRHHWGSWQRLGMSMSSAVPAWFTVSGHDLLQTAGLRSCSAIANQTNPVLAFRARTVQLYARKLINRISPFNAHWCNMPWTSECPDVKNYKWRLNLVWHRMLYCSDRMATVGIKGLSSLQTSGMTQRRRKQISSVSKKG